MNRIVSTLPVALALLLFAALPAHARTVYDVEIIVFENVDVPADPGERWRPDVVIPRFDRTVDFARDDHPLDAEPLTTEDNIGDTFGMADGDHDAEPGRAPIGAAMLMDPPDGFVRFDTDEYRLVDMRNRLTRSPRYRVLRHMGWQQPALDPDEALSLRVRAGEPMTVRVPVVDVGRLAQPVRIEEILAQATREASADRQEGAIGTTEGNGAEADVDAANGLSDAERELLQHTGLLPRTREVSVYPLDGTVRIEVRRYLHVHTDLYFTVPVDFGDAAIQSVDADTSAAAGDEESGTAVAGTALTRDIATRPDGQPVLSYPFRQHRRMRSREVHYIDHPVISMIVLVTPRESGES